MSGQIKSDQIHVPVLPGLCFWIREDYTTVTEIQRTTDFALKRMLFVLNSFSNSFHLSEVKVCYYGMKKTLWESWFSGKDYKNSSIDYKLQARALYFPKQIPSGLSLSVLSSFSFFLRWMNCLEGLLKKRGIKLKKLLFLPLLLLIPLSRYLFFSIQCYLRRFFSHSLKTPSFCTSLLP